MTWKYDISQIGRSWCLNDCLDLSNHTRSSNVGLKNFWSTLNTSSYLCSPPRSWQFYLHKYTALSSLFPPLTFLFHLSPHMSYSMSDTWGFSWSSSESGFGLSLLLFHSIGNLLYHRSCLTRGWTWPTGFQGSGQSSPHTSPCTLQPQGLQVLVAPVDHWQHILTADNLAWHFTAFATDSIISERMLLSPTEYKSHADTSLLCRVWSRMVSHNRCMLWHNILTTAFYLHVYHGHHACQLCWISQTTLSHVWYASNDSTSAFLCFYLYIFI